MTRGAAQSPTTNSTPRRGRWRILRRLAFLAAPLAILGSVLAFRGDMSVWLDASRVRRAAQERRWGDVEAPLRRWLAARPSSAAAHFARAQLAFASNNGREFLDAIGRARSLGFDERQIDRLTAFHLVRTRRYLEAETLLLRVLRESKGPDPEVDEALARALLQSYKLQPAAAVLERWARDAPSDGRPYLWMTEVDRRIRADPEQIVAHLREALRRDPKLDAARLALAEELRSLHRSEEAAAQYEAYLASHPDDPAGLLGAGVNAIERDDFKAAADLLDRALAASPANATAWRQRARVDVHDGDLNKARERLDQAVMIDPADLESLHQRGLVLSRLGRDEDARADRDAADRLREDRAELDAIQKQLVGDPSNPELRRKVAQWMFDHGQHEAGLRWTSAILADQPDDVATHRLLVEYYEKRGEAGLANFHRLHAR